MLDVAQKYYTLTSKTIIFFELVFLRLILQTVVSLQGTTERIRSREASFEELFSLLPLQTRHVECSEQENAQGIAPSTGQGAKRPAEPL